MKPSTLVLAALVATAYAATASRRATAALPNVGKKLEGMSSSAAFIFDPESLFRRLGADSEGNITCDSDADCKEIDKNGKCEKKQCRCNDKAPIFLNGKCNKVDQAICNFLCKNDFDVNAQCVDLKPKTGDFNCRCKNGWVVDNTRTKCRKYPKSECDADCRKEFGKGWTCPPNDYTQCMKSM